MSKKLRIIIPLLVLLVSGVCFALFVDWGNASAFGWLDISYICPVGALSILLANKLLVPRALISLVIAVVGIILLGKAFCGWICPVPVVSKLRDVFVGPGKKQETAEVEASGDVAALSEEEKALLKTSCGTKGGCTSCAEKHGVIDSRHLALGGALLSAAIFGFPVFCLICPIGLSFATIFLAIRAFGFGDPSLTLLVVPVILLVEVVFFRKWCHRFCPLSALMSLVGLANKTVQPSIDDATCLETRDGSRHECGRCAQACPEGIDPRHPELGNGMNECTRCMACVDACPSGALKIAFLPQTKKKTPALAEASAAEDKQDKAE